MTVDGQRRTSWRPGRPSALRSSCSSLAGSPRGAGARPLPARLEAALYGAWLDVQVDDLDLEGYVASAWRLPAYPRPLTSEQLVGLSEAFQKVAANAARLRKHAHASVRCHSERVRTSRYGARMDLRLAAYAVCIEDGRVLLARHAPTNTPDQLDASRGSGRGRRGPFRRGDPGGR